MTGADPETPVILLPPSEGKASGGGRPRWRPGSGRFRRLADARRQVAEALAAVDGGDGRMLGARGDLLVRAAAANRALVDAPTWPAWRRFTGVVWDHLDPESLDGPARARAEAGLLVVTALTGVSAWSDPVPDFRLKLSVSLDPLGRLDRFWRPTVTELFDEVLAGRTVIDLLPHEHRAAWDPESGRFDLVRPLLTTAAGSNAGHAGKAAKGRLARALLESDDVDRTLATFDADPLVLTFDPTS
jgi:cytoplasmic iron level regulating protein YaaA (DUF328/UPF0246 family)